MWNSTMRDVDGKTGTRWPLTSSALATSKPRERSSSPSSLTIRSVTSDPKKQSAYVRPDAQNARVRHDMMTASAIHVPRKPTLSILRMRSFTNELSVSNDCVNAGTARDSQRSTRITHSKTHYLSCRPAPAHPSLVPQQTQH